MNLINKLKAAVLVCCLLGFAQGASAGVISLVPNPALGDVGDSIFVDMIWEGTGDYIGDFDVDISYDDSIVELVDFIIDPDCGVDSICAGLYGDGNSSGLIDLFAVSFDSILDLIDNQDFLGNAFVLATLEFEGLAVGVTDLVFGASTFGDERGSPDGDFNPTLNNGRICVGPDGCPPVGVPEPGTISLVLLGVLALGLRRLRLA
jgi:hypothetical protein